MPTYQYECDECEYTFDILQSMLEKKLRKCPECGKNRLHRLIGAGSGIIFKGSGFYETDYKKKEPAGKNQIGSSSAKTKTSGASDKKASKKATSGKKAKNVKADQVA